MAERNNVKKEIKIGSFNFKWYEFLIVYGIYNISLFFSINSIINNINKNFSDLYTSEKILVDGADFSIFANIFATPLFVFMTVITIGFYLLQEFIIILIFKFIYFKSMVKAEEKARLYQYIKTTILCFILANIICIMFYGNISRIKFFIFLYLPIPLFTFILICLKIKKCIIKEEQKINAN